MISRENNSLVFADKADAGQAGQRQQPPQQQSTQAGKVTMLFVINQQQGVGRDRTQESKHCQHTVMGLYFSCLIERQSK